MGPLKEDAKHLAFMFKGHDVLDFIHEFGEFAHDRLLNKKDVRIVKAHFEADKTKGSMDRHEWFAQKFEQWWVERKPVPDSLARIFRKVLQAIKVAYERYKGLSPVPKNLAVLFEDIVTNGRDINEKYYYTDREVLEIYLGSF